MWPSKLKNSLLLSLFLSTGLVACSLPKPQDRDETPQDAATFFVDKAEASVTGVQNHPKISLPLSKDFSFRVCLKESKYSKPILNHTFEILGGAQVQTVVSDNSGCITWAEKLEYNHLAPAKWLEFIRSVRAKGLQKGQRQTVWALNPWENQAESLLNKKIAGVLAAKDVAAALNAESKQGIWIDDLRLTIDEKRVTPQGTVLNIEIRTSPSLPVIKTDGTRVLEPLSKGDFEAEIVLISDLTENKKEVIRPITDRVKATGKIANSALILEKEVLLKSVSRYGQIQLGLKVTPLNAPKSLGSFQGVFSIAEFDQIKGNSFSRLKNNFQEAQGKMTIDQYLTEEKTPAPTVVDSKSASGETETPGFQTSQIQIQPLEFSNVGFRTQNGINREKIFTITACMTAPIDSKMIRAQSFQVVKANGKPETLTSNTKGCIIWDDSVSFQYLDNECWLEKKIRISNSNLGLDQELSLNINPWAEGWNSLRDSRQVGEQELKCAQGKPKIVLMHYEFDKKTVQYPIDSLLNIKVAKEGILKLAARLKRPSLVDPTGFEDTNLPAGKYLLRWAIVDQSVKDFSKAAGLIYQVGEKKVQIDVAGTILDTLTFESPNLRALGNTNSILLELTPEESQGQLMPVTYRGPIVLSNINENGNLELVSEQKESLILKLKEQLQKDQESFRKVQEVLSKKETFAQSENLTLLNLNDEKMTLNFRKALAAPIGWQLDMADITKNIPPMETKFLKAWLQTGKLPKGLSRNLCGFWFLDQLRRPVNTLGNKGLIPLRSAPADRLASFCANDSEKDPKKYFEISYRYFLKNAHKVKDLTSEIKDLSFTNAFTLSQSHDESLSKTISWDVNGGINTSKWLSPFSIGGGFRYQVAKSTGDRHSESNTASVQSGEYIMLEKLTFQIGASGYEKCAVIRLNPELTLPGKSELMSLIPRNFKKEQVNEQLSKGYMICEGAPENRNVVFPEHYYILNQKAAYTQAIDVNSDFGRPLFMTVRGQNDFYRMMHFLVGKISVPDAAHPQAQTQQAPVSVVAPVFLQGISTYPGQYAADE